MRTLAVHRKENKNKGAAALPLVLVFSVLIAVISIAFSIIAFQTRFAVESERASARALHFAESGLQDGLMRLVRDRDYLCDTEDCYEMAFTQDGCTDETACAWVTVRTGTTTQARTIISRGRSGIHERIIERSFSFDTDMHGRVADVTWCELTGEPGPVSACPPPASVQNPDGNATSSSGGPGSSENEWTLTTGVTPGSTVSSSVTTANVTSSGNGFSASAFDPSGSPASISINGSPDGFGVSGAASGADAELGESGGESEKLVIEFDDPVRETDIDFFWMNASESAIVQLFDSGGSFVRSYTVQGVTNSYPESVSMTATTSGPLVSRFEFTVPTTNGYADDDYLIGAVGYTTGQQYAYTLDVSPSTSGSIVDVQLSVPTEASLSHGSMGGGGVWTLPQASSGSYLYNEDGDGGVSISGLTISLPDTFSGTLTGTTTITDSLGNTVSQPF